jgi:hypothetical protein
MFGKKMKETVLAYKRFFDTEDGKKVMADLMKSCHITSSTMSSDPYETAFNEGARSVVLRILKTVNADMSQVEEMIKKMEEQEEQYE